MLQELASRIPNDTRRAFFKRVKRDCVLQHWKGDDKIEKQDNYLISAKLRQIDASIETKKHAIRREASSIIPVNKFLPIQAAINADRTRSRFRQGGFVLHRQAEKCR